MKASKIYNSLQQSIYNNRHQPIPSGEWNSSSLEIWMRNIHEFEIDYNSGLPAQNKISTLFFQEEKASLASLLAMSLN